jgi:3'5'-cyclic nucleotide phosphodiesterase
MMSVVKLLGRIASESTSKGAQDDNADSVDAIYFDPLIQFGCVLAALVHDIDHQGVSNAQLVGEKAAVASKYNNKAVAEQNSIDIGWALFMSNEYSEFRDALCPSDHEAKRLRQILVNCVIATDIADKDLRDDRNSRWEKVFAELCVCSSTDSRDLVNQRAALVLEHLIQASDVSHCMQHWHVYRKWNECLFREMHVAYVIGRGDQHPAEFWYQGELNFFDLYIIPLAKKLRDCEVFGVSSDEFLNYAEQNREEWERRGEEVVAQMVNRLEEKDVSR